MPTPRVTWSLLALFDCWYFQLSSTVIPSVGGGGKGSPSSQEIYIPLVENAIKNTKGP